jgi:WD40 repeat protein
VTCIAFSPHRHLAVSGSLDSTVRVWDTHSGIEVQVLRGHEGWVLGVAFSADDRWVASGSSDKTVRVWDVYSGGEACCLQGHRDSVESVAFSPHGPWIVSGSRDKTVRVWDRSSGTERCCLQGHEGAVSQVAVSPNGRLVASGSGLFGGDKTVRLWDVETGSQLGRFPLEYRFDALAFALDSQIVVGGWQANIQPVVEKLVSMSPIVWTISLGADDAAGPVKGPKPTSGLSPCLYQLETAIESDPDQHAVAWWPVAFLYNHEHHVATHPSDRLWAGFTGNYLCLFRLEEGDEP